MQPIHLDYAGCLASRVGRNGVSETDLRDAAEPLAAITRKLTDERGTGGTGWRRLPFDPVRREHVRAIGEEVARREHVDTLLVLGIGGSALGNIALQEALHPHTHNLLPTARRRGPRLFVLDNIDPAHVGATLELIAEDDPRFERTLVNVISKSGETAETAAQFMILRGMLRDALGPAAAERIVAITDPERGTMRSICDAEGYATLPVPDGVGGRFSVLSPVGLFSAAMTGIDIDALLDGAAAMDERCRVEDPAANPAATLAWLLVTHAAAGRSNHVMMPYASGLRAMADWYRQLWAESLGKRRPDGTPVGPTPIAALGATDQHSQIQLYCDGPPDKVIGFVDVADFATDVAIPSDAPAPALSYLGGATLGRLLAAEKRATEYALTVKERPNYTITLPRQDAASIGQFLQLWMIATAYAGVLLGIDTYDQPAVETGKQATFGLMGRDGYAEWPDRIDAVLRAPAST
ncbi:MAG: glucose-6-phosphate isomerase [Phycisphaerales bacterium]|nr:glucose-6-phosphate isomerase [Phycisphaerales bacterium]